MLDFGHDAARRAFRSKKWTRFDEDVIPLPVADMDCRVAEPIQEALDARVAHGIFGYDHPPENAMELFTAHCKAHYDWDVDPSWVVPVAGVVPAQFAAVRAFAEGAQVAIPNPIYHSFPQAPGIAGAEPAAVPSVMHEGRETLDLDALDSTLAASDSARVALLCNPHNPGGAAYRRDELEKIAAIAAARQSVMVSDEIWADLILDDLPHCPLAKISPDWGVSILAATKTWNIAGLPLAFTLIPNPELRARFKNALMGYPPPTYLAWIATLAAYEKGEPWRQNLLQHLRQQRTRMTEFLATYPALSMTQLEATYLAWVDCRALQRPNLHADCVSAGLGPDDGELYGKPGHLRFNLACSQEHLETALARFATVLG